MNAMQAVLLKPLVAPKGAQPPALDPRQGGTQGDAWQRELRRAQSTLGAAPPVSGFLQGFGDVKLQAPPHALAVADGAEPAIIDAKAPVEATPPSLPGAPTAADHAHPTSAGGAAFVPVSFPRAAHEAHEARAAQSRELSAPASRPQIPAAVESPARPPVRVHADWSAEGVRVWLGVDAAGIDAVPSIANQLQRWLAAQGVRGVTIACNGRTLVEPSTDPFSIEPKENT